MNKNTLIIGSGFGLRVVKKIIDNNHKTNSFHIEGRKFIKNNKEIKLILKKDINFFNFIFIETPPFTHKKIIEKIFSLGFNNFIICEKPLTNNFSELIKIKNNFNPNQILVNHQLRFIPEVIYLKKLLKNNYLGKIISFQIDHLSSQNLNNGLSNWWYKKNKGGGQLMSLGSHFIDLVSYLDLLPKSFYVQMNSDSPIEKIINLSFSFKSKNFGFINSNSKSSIDSYFRLFIHGKNKSLEIINFDSFKIYEKSHNVNINFSNKIADKFTSQNFWRKGVFYFLDFLSRNNINSKEYFGGNYKSAKKNHKIISLFMLSNTKGKKIKYNA